MLNKYYLEKEVSNMNMEEESCPYCGSELVEGACPTCG